MILSARPLRVVLDSNVYIHGGPDGRLADSWAKLESLSSQKIVEVFFTYVNAYEVLKGLCKAERFEECRQQLRAASRLCAGKRFPIAADHLFGRVAEYLGLPKPPTRDYAVELRRASNAKTIDELNDIVRDKRLEHKREKARWIEYKTKMDELTKVTKHRKLHRAAAYYAVARLTWRVCLQALGLECRPEDRHWQAALNDVPAFRYQVAFDTAYLLNVLGGGSRRRTDVGDLSQIPCLDTIDYLITGDVAFYRLCSKAGKDLASACIWVKNVGELRVLPPRAPIYDDNLLPSI